MGICKCIVVKYLEYSVTTVLRKVKTKLICSIFCYITAVSGLSLNYVTCLSVPSFLKIRTHVFSVKPLKICCLLSNYRLSSYFYVFL